jgi:hypothetical protein
LLVVPSGASKTVTATWNSSISYPVIFADEFSITGGTQAFDTDAKASSSGAASVNGPTITPTNSAELLYACASVATSVSSAGSPWTLGSGGIDTTGNASEYDLSASSATTVNFALSSSGSWDSMAMAFYISSGATVAQASPAFYLDSEPSGSVNIGRAYDDDTGFNSIVPPIPKQFEQDCDTTSRNFDFNTACQQWMDGEQPPALPRIYGSPFDWDADATSRNVDFFLAQMQLLDQEQTALRIPPAPTMDWTADHDWQQQRNLFDLQPSTLDSDYYNPSPFSPLLAWDDHWEWSRNVDVRVVVDEDERELAWPIPAGAQLLKLGWDQDAEQFPIFDFRFAIAGVEEERSAQPFSPTADWTADYDWEHSTDTRVVEDEDERVMIWPVPIPPPLVLGFDQDGDGQRYTDIDVGVGLALPSDDSARPFAPVMDWTNEAEPQQNRDIDPFCHSDPAAAGEESALFGRPFAPTLAWDEVDWQHWIDSRVTIIDPAERDSMGLIAVAIAQTIAMAVQQMLCAPLLGLQLMSAIPLMLCQGIQDAPGAELGIEEIVNEL